MARLNTFRYIDTGEPMIRITRPVLSADPTEAELAEADRILDELNRKHGTVLDD